jgi:hypothetical protein
MEPTSRPILFRETSLGITTSPPKAPNYPPGTSPDDFTGSRLCDVDPQPPQLRLLDIPTAAGFFVRLEVVAVTMSSLVR